MPTVIDSLIVTLGLDSSGLVSKGTAADKTLKNLEGSSKSTEQGVKKLSDTTKTTAGSVDGLTRSLGAFLALLGGTFALRAFIEDTIASSAALDRLSKNLNVSVEDLSAWGNAVEGLGGNAKGLQGTMLMLSQAQTELRLTGQSGLVPYFASLGVAIAGVGGAARPVNEILLDLSSRFSHMDRTTAFNVGKMMGLDPDTINLLLQGREELERTLKTQKENNVVTKAQAEESAKLQKSIITLKQSFTALGRDLLQQASPALEKMLDMLSKLADWAQNNKEFLKDLGKVLLTVAAGLTAISVASSPIALTVAAILLLSAAIALLWQDYQTWKRGGDTLIDWEKWKPGIDAAKEAIRELARVVKESFGSIWSDLEAVQKLMHGDWRGALADARKSDDHFRAALKDAMHAGQDVYDGVTAVRQATAVADGQQGSQGYIKQYFIDRGWSPEQASGIAANLWAESTGNTRAVGDNGQAYGLAQWHPDRQKAFKDFTGKDIRDSGLDEQLNFVNHEIHLRGGADLSKATTAADAAAIVSRQYEGPKDADGEAYRRGNLAQSLMGIKGATSNLQSAGSSPGASPSTATDDHSVSVQTGPITINSPSTDGAGLARDFVKSFNFHFTAQANTGLQ
jgi:hypothetical protein